MATTTSAELGGSRPTMAQSNKDDQNRRSACDRCRKQKLRCERRNTATLTEACNRCLKSRSKCITGPSLPMGRPRIRTRSMSPFDYRSMSSKRDFHSPVSDMLHSGMPHMTKSHTSPNIHDPAVTAVPDIPITSVSAVSMLPPTTLAMLGMHNEPKLMHDGVFPDYTGLYQPAPQVMRPPSSGTREDYIRNLYDLNAQLLGQCFEQSKSGASNQWGMGHPSSIDSIVAGITHPVDHNQSRLSLGELLESSNEFLRISQALMFSATRKSPVTSRHSSIDYSNPHYATNAYHQIRTSNAPTYSPVSPGYDDKDSNFSPSSMPSLSSSVATSMSPGIPERLDFPSLLTLYNSYTTLLRIYRTILTRVHLAILSQPMPWSALEAIVPGIYPEGVQVEQRPDLQVKVFVQMCREMLEQMEKNITLSTKFYHAGAEPDFLRSLVDNLVKAEAAEGAARIVSPKCLVDDILRTMDGSLTV